MKDDDFRTFLIGERKKFVHYVRSLVKETGQMEAEDIVHDVLIKILERADVVAPMEFAPAYIYRSLRNRVIDLMRTGKQPLSLDTENGGIDEDGASLMDVLADNGPGALDILQSREGKRELFEALEELSDMERTVIIAHEFEGMSFRDLSEQLGVPQNTLLSHKSRGMKKLRRRLLSNKGEDNVQ